MITPTARTTTRPTSTSPTRSCTTGGTCRGRRRRPSAWRDSRGKRRKLLLLLLPLVVVRLLFPVLPLTLRKKHRAGRSRRTTRENCQHQYHHIIVSLFLLL